MLQSVTTYSFPDEWQRTFYPYLLVGNNESFKKVANILLFGQNASLITDFYHFVTCDFQTLL